MKITSFLFSIFLFSSVAFAKSEDYLFRQRLDWVKIRKASAKEVPVGNLTHPFSVSTDQMEAMLRSIQIGKKYLLKKELRTRDVFNESEARKYAPFIAEGLSKVDPEQVVHFSLVHKRPIYFLKNDFISMGNVWVDSEGVHVSFSKLFAALKGDYEASAEMDRAVHRAKSRRVSLDAGPGQKLSYQSVIEIILDPAHDFGPAVAQKDTAVSEEMTKKKEKKSKRQEEQPAKAPEAVSERLQELDRLKKEGLVSPQEYQELRKKILSAI